MQCAQAAQRWTCGQVPGALLEASEQGGSFGLHKALCRARQAAPAAAYSFMWCIP